MDRERRKKYAGWLRKGILAECVLVLALAALMPLAWGKREAPTAGRSVSTKTLSVENDYIKWVDFTVSYEALCKAYEWDVATHGTEYEIGWVDLLAYTAAKTGGSFGNDALKAMDKAAEKLSKGDCTLEELTEDLKYYSYYREAYGAAIGGLVGEYKEEYTDALGNTAYEEKYGLKGYFPLARGFDYTHYDDFGVGRSYGYQRKHLGWYVIIVSSWQKISKIKGFRCFRPRLNMPFQQHFGAETACFCSGKRKRKQLDTKLT